MTRCLMLMQAALCWLSLRGAADLECRASESVPCDGNGCLIDNECVCDSGWTGARCGQLDVVGPAHISYGGSASSWGGSVVRTAQNKYSLFVDEIVQGCGLSAWRTNSRIVRAESNKPTGPFKRREVVISTFAHNAMLVPQSPHNPWLLLHLEGQSTPRDCERRRRLTRRPPRSKATLGATVLFSESVLGPWNNATVLKCSSAHFNCDFANPAMTVDRKTGEAFVAYKVIHGPRRGKALAFASAPRWRGPYSPIGDRRWNQHPQLPCDTEAYAQCEDPFIWTDKRGGLHVLFHHADGRLKRDAGGHAFSSDGGLTWGPLNEEVNAYGSDFTFANGDTADFSRVQRPQLLLNDRFEPTHLIIGVAGDRSGGPFTHPQCNISKPHSSPPCDRTFTLVQPLRGADYPFVPVITRPTPPASKRKAPLTMLSGPTKRTKETKRER